MYTHLLSELESSIRDRNPLLASLLKPGLTQAQIRQKLERGKALGSIEPLIALYSWHDGVQGKPCITMEEVSFFPSFPYTLTSLEWAMIHFKDLPERAKNNPAYRQAVGRFFPIFWDGSSDFISLDLLSPNGRIIVTQINSPELIREGYPSFEAFLADGVAANRAMRPLKCLL